MSFIDENVHFSRWQLWFQLHKKAELSVLQREPMVLENLYKEKYQFCFQDHEYSTTHLWRLSEHVFHLLKARLDNWSHFKVIDQTEHQPNWTPYFHSHGHPQLSGHKCFKSFDLLYRSLQFQILKDLFSLIFLYELQRDSPL